MKIIQHTPPLSHLCLNHVLLTQVTREHHLSSKLVTRVYKSQESTFYLFGLQDTSITEVHSSIDADWVNLHMSSNRWFIEVILSREVTDHWQLLSNSIESSIGVLGLAGPGVDGVDRVVIVDVVGVAVVRICHPGLIGGRKVDRVVIIVPENTRLNTSGSWIDLQIWNCINRSHLLE